MAQKKMPNFSLWSIGNVKGKLRDLLHIPRYLGQLETGRSTGAGANGGWLCRDAAPQSSVFIDNLHTVLRAAFLAAQVSFGGGWRHREVVCAPIGALPSTKKEQPADPSLEDQRSQALGGHGGWQLKGMSQARIPQLGSWPRPALPPLLVRI